MQSHPIEIAAIAQATHLGNARVNLYAGIHKALRAVMTDTLLALGRADPGDEAELRDACDRVVELVEMCERHIAHENTFVHPLLRQRCPGACDGVAREHDEHLHHIAQLREAATAMAAVPADERAQAMHALYLALGLFVADNFTHMHTEETRHNEALWAAFTDLELLAAHDELLASIPPAEMMLVARWMLPSVAAPERTAMLNDLQENAPAPVLDAMLDLARRHLNDRDWAKLTRSVNLPPVPGLVVV